MATPHLSAEHRDEICRSMVSVFIRNMKSDTRLGEKWQGLSHSEQEDTAESMFNKLRPLMDDIEAVVTKNIDFD